MLKKLVLLGLVALLSVSSSQAQAGFSEGDAPMRGAGLTAVAIDFSFDGTAPSEVVFTFDGPAFGLFYDREPLLVSYIRGTQDIGPQDRLVLTDFSISGWMPFRPFGLKASKKADLFLPIGIDTNYRRIKRTQGDVEVDAFEYTVIAAGAGLGLIVPVFKGELAARGLSYYGIATRSFGNSTDSSAIVDVEIDWSSPLLTNRFGIQIGYGYRWQKWYSDLGDFAGQSYDFVGKHHALRLGLTF